MAGPLTPRLVALAGPLAETVIPLEPKEVTIGRGVTNQICIADPILSRQHCVITQDNDQFLIRDLGSLHGTVVNGMPITQQYLQHGDQISLGSSVFLVMLHQAETRPQRSRAELEEGSAMQGVPTLLREEDAVYLKADSNTTNFAQGSRVARDLNTLLVIAKNISKLRDHESLAWELLGMIFDVVPADRGAILAFGDEPQQINWSAAWDRRHGPGVPVRVSRTIASRVVRDQTGLLLRDVTDNAELRKSASCKHGSSKNATYHNQRQYDKPPFLGTCAGFVVYHVRSLRLHVYYME